MKNTLYYVLPAVILALGLTLSCQNEDGIDRENSSEKIINHFFNDKDVESPWTKNAMSIMEKSISLKTRSDTTDVIKNFIDRFGQPIWKEAIELGSDENDFAILVPVVNKSCDEIETILYFIIEEGKYKFYPVQRNLIDKDDIEKLLPFDYFTYNTLKKKPKSGIVFKEMEETPKTRGWYEGVECRQIESYAGADNADYISNPENWNSRWVCKNVYKYIPDNSWGNTHNEKKDYIERDEFGGGGGDGPAHGGGAKEPSNPNDEIIKDESFKDSKADCIYEKLEKLEGDLKNTINKFNDKFTAINLKLSCGDLGTYHGETNVVKIGDKYFVNIKINQNKFDNIPNIVIASTIMHEFIHGEMFRRIFECFDKKGIDPFYGVPKKGTKEHELFLQELKNSYYRTYEFFTKYGEQFDHDLMAEDYIDIMASLLNKFDNRYSIEECRAISWEGLMETEAWRELCEKDNTKENEIKSTIIKINGKGGEECI